MKLDRFISESLIAIYQAVQTAQERSPLRVEEPRLLSNSSIPAGFVPNQHGDYLMPIIEFDIAVTVDTQGEVQAGIGGTLSVVGIGLRSKLKASESTISRIRFSVPISLPVPETNSLSK